VIARWKHGVFFPARTKKASSFFGDNNYRVEGENFKIKEKVGNY
jgi:hypothetical protein